VHTTVCTSNAGDEPKRRDLCSECFESSYHTEASGITKAWEAGCQYCGGPPEMGGADPLATLGGTQKLRCMCRPCAEEYARFLRQKWPGFGDVAMTSEQRAKIHPSDIPIVFREADEHMKKWVADRGSQ
jgi:hypothetical protein